MAHNETAERRIYVLPEALANQIAAGEVVERPASVVKELVENAIDAGATRVLVDLEEAGRGLVRVVDDGLGMSAEDAALAVLRHATSKVRTSDDLAAIGTLGFRGEALPSIASVSRFTLTTRRAEDEAATQVRIEGGAAPVLGSAAGAVGTRIEVRDLFWNVPARLKFLKTDHTETQHVIELVKGFALGYPGIHFRLGTGARTALDFPSVRRLYERVVQVLGKDAGSHLYEVALAGDSAVRVNGFVSNAREAKATQSAMTTFVNGRRVKDKTVAHAIISAFGSDLQAGRFPQAVLWIYLDPAEVDVNVHPAKAEVRFRQPQVVHEAVTRALQAMLLERPWIANAPLPLERAFIATQSARPRIDLFGVGERDHRRPEQASDQQRMPRATELRFGPPIVGATPRPEGRPPEPWPGGNEVRPARSDQRALVATTPERWRLLAKNDRWVIAEGPPGLALFEPRALFTAMTFAALRASPKPIASQPLLLPARLDLSPLESERLARRAAALTAIGLQIEPFGGTTHQLLGLPLPALMASPPRVLAEIAAQVARDASDDDLLASLAKLAADAAVARGLDDKQLAALIEHVPRALAARDGAFLLGSEEITRRLGSDG